MEEGLLRWSLVITWPSFPHPCQHTAVVSQICTCPLVPQCACHILFAHQSFMCKLTGTLRGGDETVHLGLCWHSHSRLLFSCPLTFHLPHGNHCSGLAVSTSPSHTLRTVPSRMAPGTPKHKEGLEHSFCLPAGTWLPFWRDGRAFRG